VDPEAAADRLTQSVDATDVDVAGDRRRCRGSAASGYVRGITETVCPKGRAMTPIAAYFVMTMTDAERETRARNESKTPRPTTLAERVAAALEALVRLGRPATVQPI
jgi:hypothetical protein